MESTLLKDFEEYLVKIAVKDRWSYKSVVAAATPGLDSVVMCHLLKEVGAKIIGVLSADGGPSCPDWVTNCQPVRWVNCIDDLVMCGVRPLRATGSGGGFDRVPGVLILELLRAQISERRV